MVHEEKPYPTSIRWDFEGGSVNILIVGNLWFFVSGNLKDSTYALRILTQAGNGDQKPTLAKYEPVFNGNTFFPRLFPLEPGENNFTLIAIQNGQASETKKFTVLGDGFSYKSRGIELQLAGRWDSSIYPKKLLDELVVLIESANVFLENPIKLVRGSRGIGTFSNFGPEKQILVDRKYFEVSYEMNDSIYVKIVFWHEIAHKFVEQVTSQNTVKIEEAYLNLRKTSIALFELFHESSYFNTSNPWGHPNSNAEELFVSASSVMCFFPKQFIARTNELPEESRKAVVETAKIVLGLYLSNGSRQKNIFDPKLVEFLGLGEHEDKKAVVR